MLFHYWPTANGAGPTLKQHWVSLRVCWESCPHYDTRVPSVSGWNRLHSALCTLHQFHPSIQRGSKRKLAGTMATPKSKTWQYNFNEI